MSMKSPEIPYKIYLSEEEIPQAWYNMRADMKTKPAPLLNPGTGKPMTAGELGAVFLRRAGGAGAGQRHRLCSDPAGDPRLLQDVPPLAAGARLLSGREAGTPAHIYYEARGQQHLRQPLAQLRHRLRPITPRSRAWKGVTTETGAGQWGTALSMACAYLGLSNT